jgi:hypothetical protein
LGLLLALGDTERLGLALGEADRLGLALGDADRLGLGLVPVRLGEGEFVTPPVHVTPLRVNVLGMGLLDVQAPLNPIWVEPLVARLLFQSRLTAVTLAPDCAQVADHPDVTAWPAAGNAKPRVQPLVIGSPRFVMVTYAVNPPGHWFGTV